MLITARCFFCLSSAHASTSSGISASCMLGAHSTFSVKCIHRGLKWLCCVREEAFQTKQTSLCIYPVPLSTC